MLNILDNDLTPRPAFRLTIDGTVSANLDARLMSLTHTDNRGFEADRLELTIDDSDGLVSMPARGAKVNVAIGWQGEALVSKGMFVVDEVSHQGPPDRLIVTASSADFRDDFNVKREYSWHNVTVGDVVSAIAGRYKLKPAVSVSLKDIGIDHADQTSESDISFLTRMAQMLGAVATVKNGSLLFIVPGKGVSASGRVLPAVTITRESGDSHSFRVADRDAYTGVQAYWMDLNFGKKKPTTVKRRRKEKKINVEPASSKKEGDYVEGAEGNVFVMRQTFKTERAARRAAAAKWNQLQRGAAEFNITLARGRADLFPELHANVSGFKPTIDAADWVIKQVNNTIDENGFITGLELEVRITDWDAEEVGDNSE
ncbi:phage late control D family protein [Pantoea sp. SORGH_AS_0659]|uniref:phage late control D family protein n=1 Tax=Pantoea sp. SORGH_AS_0659 TaxID=3062597 RepID=UPI002859C4DD|nr:phage late control D family protein [Pantoea sp. SORGH_AS_0659]MDR6348537.1 phage protein D [Pantoea sp. SORGH_AS_0659]